MKMRSSHVCCSLAFGVMEWFRDNSPFNHRYENANMCNCLECMHTRYM